jgi:hypothetical protein
MIAISPLLLLLALLLAFTQARVPSNDIDLAELSTNEIEALTWRGAASYNKLGWSVRGAGDVNGDGFDDLLVCAPGADPNGRADAGAVYASFGNANGPATIDTLNFTSGDSTGFVIWGAVAGDQLGRSVSGAGDVNNDTYADVIVGVPYADPNGRSGSGAAYVIFGMKDGFADVDLLDFASGLLGFIIWGAVAGD